MVTTTTTTRATAKPFVLSIFFTMLIFPSFTIKQKQKQTKNTTLNINRKGKLFNLRSVAWDEEGKRN